jgi:hypothetical protein
MRGRRTAMFVMVVVAAAAVVVAVAVVVVVVVCPLVHAVGDLGQLPCLTY